MKAMTMVPTSISSRTRYGHVWTLSGTSLVRRSASTTRSLTLVSATTASGVVVVIENSQSFTAANTRIESEAEVIGGVWGRSRPIVNRKPMQSAGSGATRGPIVNQKLDDSRRSQRTGDAAVLSDAPE